MQRLRFLLSVLVAVCALALALVRPLASRADDGTTPAPAPSSPAPADVNPVVPPLPVLKRPRPQRAQLHLPFGDRVVGFARHLLGTRYVWGGSSPRSGFDCSGFVRYVYGHFGIPLAHSSYAQFDRGRRVSRKGLKPGDLVFFDGLGHVGIYVGKGHFIHAPHTGTRVRIETLGGWYGSRYDGARRLHAA
jgi:cell wall-associated NlpC family hydrolase